MRGALLASEPGGLLPAQRLDRSCVGNNQTPQKQHKDIQRQLELPFLNFLWFLLAALAETITDFAKVGQEPCPETVLGLYKCFFDGSNRFWATRRRF